MCDDGGASRDMDGPSESECTPATCERCFRGVLCSERLTGEAGDEGGEESCVGARAKRAFFTVVGGGVLCWSGAFGERSALKEE